MFDLTLEDDIPTILGKLTDVERKQVPFAMVSTLNDTAFEARSVVVRELKKAFTIRGNWSGGFQVDKATKTKLEARLGSLHEGLVAHLEGGTLHAQGSSGRFVPSLAVREGEAFSGKIKRGMKPKALMKKISKASARAPKRRRGGRRKDPKPFLIKKMPNGGSGIFVRSGEGRLPLVRLYSIKDQVKIKKRFLFRELAEDLSSTRLRVNFIKNLDRGLKTAKGGGVKSSYVTALKGKVELGGGFASPTLANISR